MSTSTSTRNALVPWRSIPVNRLDGGRMGIRDHLLALREYRETGGIAHIVLHEVPPGPLTPEEGERLCEAGPAPEEIDWYGFDDEVKAELGAAANEAQS